MEKIGRYDVVRTLGRGGMGEVYLARDPKLERQVALKVLNRDDGPDSRGLFESEAKALAALNHPNIVTIFEISGVGDRQFIAMEYLPGRALRELLVRDRPPRDTLVAICGQVATALAAAHEAGILHRDIKPENIVVGKASAVKVVDFGIARRLDSTSIDPANRRDESLRRLTSEPKPDSDIEARAAQLVDLFTGTVPIATVGSLPTVRSHDNTTLPTSSEPVASFTNTVFGTPAYMAPEVLMGEPSSTAADVYSLGVVLHECLAGRRPFDAPNLHEVIARVIDGEQLPARIDDPLAELVARMIDRDPKQRPSLDEITRTLSRRRSVIAVPAPRRWRWVAPIAAALVLSAATVGFVVSREGGAPAKVVIDRGPIAIRDFDPVTIPSYGVAPDPRVFGRTLALLIGTTKIGIVSLDLRGTAPIAHDKWIEAAKKASAKLLVGASIIETDGKLVAVVEITDLATGVVTRETINGDADRTAELMRGIANWIVGVVRPGALLEATNRTLAGELVAIGDAYLRERQSNKARTVLEQAVNSAPDSALAWDRYAASLAMMAAKRATVLQAAERAYTLADGPRKRILHGTLLIYRGEFAAALAELAPLENTGLEGGDLRDLMFSLGESHWHEGRHDQGFEYFKRTLEVDAASTEAASHAGEYGIVRRNEAIAREYTRALRMPLEHVDFALGRYEQLAKTGPHPFNTWAKVVLGHPVERTKSPFAQHPEIYDQITAAAAKGDRAEVERMLAKLGPELEPFTTLTGSLLAQMGEVLLVAEMPAAAKQILEILRVKQPMYQFKRLSILASPWLGAPKFDRAVLTERLATLTTAIDAELAGDRDTAAKLLDELVKNPTHEWDFVERFALMRNLRALGRHQEADAVCADTLKPTVLRYVFHVARARCVR